MNPLIGAIILTTPFKLSKPQVLNSGTHFPFRLLYHLRQKGDTRALASEKKLFLNTSDLQTRALYVLMDIWKKISTRLSHPLLELSAINT